MTVFISSFLCVVFIMSTTVDGLRGTRRSAPISVVGRHTRPHASLLPEKLTCEEVRGGRPGAFFSNVEYTNLLAVPKDGNLLACGGATSCFYIYFR